LGISPEQIFVTSSNFTMTGLPEPRAFGLARTVPSEMVAQLNVALSSLRDQGIIANLLEEYVAPPPPTPALNLGITYTQYLAVIICVGVLFGIFMIVLYFSILEADVLTPAQRAKQARHKSKQYFGQNPCMTVSFKRVYGEYLPARCVTFSLAGAPVSCETPEKSAKHLVSLLHLCHQAAKKEEERSGREGR